MAIAPVTVGFQNFPQKEGTFDLGPHFRQREDFFDLGPHFCQKEDLFDLGPYRYATYLVEMVWGQNVSGLPVSSFPQLAGQPALVQLPASSILLSCPCILSTD